MWYFENEWMDCDTNWHKWSTGQRHQMINFGGQEIKRQGHVSPKIGWALASSSTPLGRADRSRGLSSFATPLGQADRSRGLSSFSIPWAKQIGLEAWHLSRPPWAEQIFWFGTGCNQWLSLLRWCLLLFYMDCLLCRRSLTASRWLKRMMQCGRSSALTFRHSQTCVSTRRSANPWTRMRSGCRGRGWADCWTDGALLMRTRKMNGTLLLDLLCHLSQSCCRVSKECHGLQGAPEKWCHITRLL